MKKRHTPEQIVRKLRETKAKLATGDSVSQVARELGISEATFHRAGGTAMVASARTP